MPKILAALYLLLMVAAGWRLFTMAWSRGLKIAAAIALIIPIPMFFLLPSLMHPARDRHCPDRRRRGLAARRHGGGMAQGA
jgi:hypothetical protein